MTNAASRKPAPAPAAAAPQLKPVFSKINLLPINIVTALFIRHEDYQQAMREIGIAEENWHAWPEPGGAWQATYRNGSNFCGKHAVVCLGDFEDLDGIDIASILAHEAVHVWQAHCDHVGERCPAIEQSAYAVQSQTEYLMREFVRQGGFVS